MFHATKTYTGQRNTFDRYHLSDSLGGTSISCGDRTFVVDIVTQGTDTIPLKYAEAGVSQ